MNSTCRYAVFIETEGALREAVLTWKARVETEWPAAAYLHHPPHSTLWVGELDDPSGVEQDLRDAAARSQEFCIQANSPLVFYDDALAGGGQTCVFAVPLTEALARLQLTVAELLRARRKAVDDVGLPETLRREPYLSSWREYGFPFVGGHWVPHCTVASLPVRRDDPLVAEFLAASVSWQSAVQAISWWRVAGQRHERLAYMPFAKARP